jgi:heptaprenyl diphosphate synthase
LSVAHVEQLGRYGANLGLALRIHADVLLLHADQPAAVRADLFTLPVIYAAEAEMSQLSRYAEQDPAEIVAAVLRTGGDQRARAEVAQLLEQARAALDGLPDVPARAELLAIAQVHD